jgi:hypothetical protein
VRALSLFLLLVSLPAAGQVPLARVAREGLPAPEREGHTFVSFAESAVDDLGGVAFAAFTRAPGEPAERSLWHMTPSGRLKLIASEGALASVGDEVVTLHTLGAPHMSSRGATAWVTATVGGLPQEGVLLFDEDDRLSFLGEPFPVFEALPVDRSYWVSPDEIHVVVELSDDAHRSYRYDVPSRRWVDSAVLDVGVSVAHGVTVYGITDGPRRLVAFVDTPGDASGLYAFDLVNDVATPLLLEAQPAPPPWVAHRIGRPEQVAVSEGVGVMVKVVPVADDTLGEPSAPDCPLGALLLLGLSSNGAPALTHLCDSQAPTVDGTPVVLSDDEPLAYIGASYALLAQAGDDEVVLRNGAVHARSHVALGTSGLLPSALTRLGDSLAGPTFLELVDDQGLLTWARHKAGQGWQRIVGEGDIVHADDGPVAAFLPPARRPAGAPRQSNSAGQATLRAVDDEGRASLLLLDSEAQTGLSAGLRLSSSLDDVRRPGFSTGAPIPTDFRIEALGQPLVDVQLRARLVGGNFTALPQACTPLEGDGEVRCALDDALVGGSADVALTLIIPEVTGGLLEVTATGTRADGTTLAVDRRWQLIDIASADLAAFPFFSQRVSDSEVDLTVLIENRGPSDANNIRLTCSVFDGVVVTPIAEAGDCEPVVNQLGTAWTCGLVSLAPFEGVAPVVRLSNLPLAGEVIVRCDVTSATFDPFTSNNLVEFPIDVAVGDGDGDGDRCDGLCGDGDGDGDGIDNRPMGPFAFLGCVCIDGHRGPPPAAAILMVLLFALSARPRRRA